MHTGTGQITEIHLDGSARIDCAPELVPAPGQYLLAYASASDAPLAVPVFLYESTPNGFHFAPPLHPFWTLGTRVDLRGPLGHGFVFPSSARKVALIAFDDSPALLRGLMSLALGQDSEIVLVCNAPVQNLPEIVEIQPLAVFKDVCKWADFIALDVSRENLNGVKEIFVGLEQVPAAREAQILIRTSMPCGGLAECGVCAVTVRHDWRMACKDGPVFLLKDIIK
jgi:hypothetical protein